MLNFKVFKHRSFPAVMFDHITVLHPQVMHLRTSRDSVTGLAVTRCQAGRPRWHTLLQHISDHRKVRNVV